MNLTPEYHQVGEGLLAVASLKSWTKSPPDPPPGVVSPSGDMGFEEEMREPRLKLRAV